jgi:hypothetical protein
VLGGLFASKYDHNFGFPGPSSQRISLLSNWEEWFRLVVTACVHSLPGTQVLIIAGAGNEFTSTSSYAAYAKEHVGR